MAKAADGERRFVDYLLDSARLPVDIPADLFRLDPADPLVAEALDLYTHQPGDGGLESMSFDELAKRLREQSVPLAPAIERLLTEERRAEVYRRLLEARPDLAAADKPTADATLYALAGVDHPPAVLGILHEPLMRALRRAAELRLAHYEAVPPQEKEAAGGAAEGGGRADGGRTVGAHTGDPVEGVDYRAAWSRLVAQAERIRREGAREEDAGLVGQDAPDALVTGELAVRLFLADVCNELEELAAGREQVAPWIAHTLERRRELDRKRERLVRTLAEQDSVQAVRICVADFHRAADAPEQAKEPEGYYKRALEFLLSQEDPERLPLLVLLTESAEKLGFPRETAHALRSSIQVWRGFPDVRRKLRRLQSGEPVVVPADVDFDEFCRAELSRRGYAEDDRDPQVLGAIRSSWHEAMHEASFYLSPRDIPALDLSEVLGESGNYGSVVEAHTAADPDWLIRPTDESEGGPSRLAQVYEEQARRWTTPALQRLHRKQVRMAVADMVRRATELLFDGERERAGRFVAVAEELFPDLPLVRTVRKLIE